MRNASLAGTTRPAAVAPSGTRGILPGRARTLAALAAALAATACLAVSAPNATADPLHCKNQYVFGTGWALQQSKARKRGRHAWATRVIFKYGLPYRHWELGRQRQYGCNRKSGGWSCTAFAHPCRI
jgi:hypothetical protein